MNKATPITSALKRKYSPFKETEAQKEARKLLVDESGESVYAQTSIKTPGTAGQDPTMGYSGGGSFQNKDQKDWYNNQIQKRLDAGMSQEDAIQDYRDTFKIGKKNVVLDEGTPGTEGSEQKSKVKLKTGVMGTTKRSYQSREDLRGGTQAASKSKRAATSEARAQNKLAKMDYDKDNPLKPGDKGYVKQQRLLAKIDKQRSRQRQAGAEVENFARMSEEGKTGAKDDKFYKGQRDTEQGELTRDEQAKLEVNTSGPGAAKKFYGGSGANLSSDLGVDTSLSGTVKEALKFSPNKFKANSIKAPMKKLSDLSGDGKITKKDVLIGRGVISKDGSPAKYGNKKSPYKMKGYGSKRY
jgi:hypothetical protein